MSVVLYVLDTTADTTDDPAAGRAVSFGTEEAGEAGRAGAATGGESGEGGVGEGEGERWPGAVAQYEALRRELYLYNPEYLARPHIVALNKLDLPLARGGPDAMAEAHARVGKAIAASAAAARAQTAPPVAIVPLSGLRGKGIKILKEAIRRALEAAEQQGGGADGGGGGT